MTSLSQTQRSLALLAGFLVLFVGGGSRFAIGLTLKPMVDEFGWARADVGSAVATFQIVSAICMFVAGRLSDRISLKAVLGSGIAIAGIGIGLMRYVSAPWHAVVLYGIVFAIGNGTASIIPVGVMITRAFPKRTGFTNAIASAGASAGQLVIISSMAAVLVAVGWRNVFVWLGLAHFALLPLIVAGVPQDRPEDVPRIAPHGETGLGTAARTQQFWLLLAIYGICGFNDFFVTTHVVAFAQDRGVDAFLAGNLLALMGLTGLAGVIAAGAWSDKSGPIRATVWTFFARIAAFGLVAIDQSAVSVTIFALVFGATFLITAPLTVMFVRESFGVRHLGTLSGLITMVHHFCGGIGAYLGAALYDATGRYSGAFVIMLVSAIVALALTSLLSRTPRGAAQSAG
jgi:predicted MFS family arabinose efflux permease